jgi:HlyD family secretion protein
VKSSRTKKITLTVALLLILAWLQYPGFVISDYQLHFNTIKRDDLVVMVTAPGTVKPVTTVEVSSQLSGQIAEVLVDFNQQVTAGQAMARLDAASHTMAVRQATAEAQSAGAQLQLARQGIQRADSELANARAVQQVAAARLEGARAREENARRAYERKQSLQESKNIPVSDVEEAQGLWLEEKALIAEHQAQIRVQEAAATAAAVNLEMARARVGAAESVLSEREAALEKARIELARTEIRAPIDGVVILRNVSPGQTVAASLQAPVLFTVAQDLSSIELEVAVDEADIGQLELGQYAIFSVDAYPGEVFRGRVEQIRKAPRSIQSVVTYVVVIAAENPREHLLPGMTAMVRIAVEDSPNTLVAPNTALRFTPPPKLQGSPAAAGETVLWRRGDGDKLIPVAVETGITDTLVTELHGGLTAGDEVATGVTMRGRYLNLLGLHFALGDE